MILNKAIAFISAWIYVQGLLSDVSRIGKGKSFCRRGGRRRRVTSSVAVVVGRRKTTTSLPRQSYEEEQYRPADGPYVNLTSISLFRLIKIAQQTQAVNM